MNEDDGSLELVSSKSVVCGVVVVGRQKAHDSHAKQAGSNMEFPC